MGKILMEILLAAFLGVMYSMPQNYCGGTAADLWEEDFGEEDLWEEDFQVEERSRGVFSAYVVCSLPCLRNGKKAA